MNERLEEQLELTAQLVEQFEASNDEVETPRSVDHFMTVPRRQADALCADLQALGFRIYNRKGGLRRVSLEFDRDDAVDAASAQAFVRQIMEVADRHGGDYDGWGAMSLPRDRESSDKSDDLSPEAE